MVGATGAGRLSGLPPALLRAPVCWDLATQRWCTTAASNRLSVSEVVGVAFENGESAIELFQQNYSRQLMRQCHPAE